MRDELDSLLCSKYPKMFVNRHKSMQETCMCWGFSCGDGWFNIIDQLCSNIQHYIDWAEGNYKRDTEYNSAVTQAKNGNIAKLAEYFKDMYMSDERIDEAINGPLRTVKEPPTQVVVDQVKEKFGTLRFYYTGGNDQIRGMVSMAESMSGVTCEECGAPGTTVGRGWIRTLCEVHNLGKNSNCKTTSSEIEL